MPVIVDKELPAYSKLREHGFPVLSFNEKQPLLPVLHIGLLNLMPLKERTEEDFIRVLSQNPYNIYLDLIETDSYRGTHTSPMHMNRFYKKWSDVKIKNYDGFIITGAPVEEIPFEDVTYWNEICSIMEHCHNNIKSTLYICWGALASLFYFYKIPKYKLDSKISGVYRHDIIAKDEPLMFNLFPSFYVPHSRNSTIRNSDIDKIDEIKIVASCTEAGIHCLLAGEGREIFLLGHHEYAADTLDFEFKRDSSRGLSPLLPENYYHDNNPEKDFVASWISDGQQLFANWLNYYVKK